MSLVIVNLVSLVKGEKYEFGVNVKSFRSKNFEQSHT